MQSLLEWLIENRKWLIENSEWLFSGIGVPILGGIVSLSISFLKKKLKRTFSSQDTAQNKIFSPTLDTTLTKSISETEQIANRFNEFLNLLNQKGQKFTIGQLAKIMQLKSVGELEQIFQNKKEPDFEFIRQFCKCFFLNEEWLVNGKGKPFILDDTPMHYSPDAYLEYFKKRNPSGIYFVMSNSPIREAFFILKYEDWQYEIIQRQWHISSHVGNGGSRQLHGMYRLIKSLRKDGDLYIRCTGYLLNPESFEQLYEGSIFPDNILCNDKISHWWDDLTDINHTSFTAPNYAELYGEEFIYAQHIIRSQLKAPS